MNPLREALRRWIRGGRESDAARYSYRVFWTREARRWPADRRKVVLAAVRHVVGSAGFVENRFDRRYAVEGLDDSLHAGESLTALIAVLEALGPEATAEQEERHGRS